MSTAYIFFGSVLFFSLSFTGHNKSEKSLTSFELSNFDLSMTMQQNNDVITFGAGCFWCVESIFQQVKGVKSATSGYMGGHTSHPNYELVSTGETGYAEVVQVVYDSKEISFPELLEIYWSIHDPTTLNRQGADIGSQYRSVIFYYNQEQKEDAEKYKNALDASHAFSDPIVTEIRPAGTFYKAEDHHENYYRLNKEQPYCQMVIRPKLDKFKKAFKHKLKD